MGNLMVIIPKSMTGLKRTLKYNLKPYNDYLDMIPYLIIPYTTKKHKKPLKKYMTKIEETKKQES